MSASSKFGIRPPTAGAIMTPRLKSSTKWTELPADFRDKIRSVFAGQFPKETAQGEFLIDGRIYPDELLMRAGYLESGRLKQINFEVSVDLVKGPSAIASEIATAQGLAGDVATDDLDGGVDSVSGGTAQRQAASKTMSRIYLAIDALGSLMEEYFQTGDAGEMDLPLHWREFDFEGERLYIQHSTVNTRLEEEADRLLREAGLDLDDDGESLVHESRASEDALGNAEIDSDLAFEIQKMIRAGTYPRTSAVRGEPGADDSEVSSLDGADNEHDGEAGAKSREDLN